MAENCTILDPWFYKQPWMTESSARDNAILTRALQISISSNTTTSSSTTTATKSPDTVSAATSAHPFHLPQPSISADRRRALLPGGRISKRKPRASKRSQTTFINTDAENFREMVQRITGGQFSDEPEGRIEPVRPVGVNRPVQLPSVCLPTLDTSAFLLNRGMVEPVRDESFECDVPVDEPVFDCDAFYPTFPTLESWCPSYM